MTDMNYLQIVFKLIDRASELSKTNGGKYSAAGGYQAAFTEVETQQPLDVEATLGYEGPDRSEYIHITMKPNGNIFLNNVSHPNSITKIDNPENEDQVVDAAFMMLAEILKQ